MRPTRLRPLVRAPVPRWAVIGWAGRRVERRIALKIAAVRKKLESPSAYIDEVVSRVKECLELILNDARHGGAWYIVEVEANGRQAHPRHKYRQLM